ncbi:hypothetical protein C3L33_18746, partial [Rhododendron williamsianum]
MGQAEKQRETNNPRDLIQTLNFSNFLGKFEESVVTTEDDEESIELSLGLSLNGRFGVDPQREKILSRSSSVSAFIFTNEKQGNENRVCVGQGLMRTCSLPAEGEEEWRKRKVAQTARRMEAKRKRVEKLRNLKSQGSGESSFGESLKSQGKLDGIVVPPIPSSQGSVGSIGRMNGCTEAEALPASTLFPSRMSRNRCGVLHVPMTLSGHSTSMPTSISRNNTKDSQAAEEHMFNRFTFRTTNRPKRVSQALLLVQVTPTTLRNCSQTLQHCGYYFAATFSNIVATCLNAAALPSNTASTYPNIVATVSNHAAANSTAGALMLGGLRVAPLFVLPLYGWFSRMNGYTEARTSSVHSLPNQNDQKHVVNPKVKSASLLTLQWRTHR